MMKVPRPIGIFLSHACIYITFWSVVHFDDIKVSNLTHIETETVMYGHGLFTMAIPYFVGFSLRHGIWGNNPGITAA